MISNAELRNKYKSLLNNIKALKKVAIAFSGGVDSVLLLKAAKDALGDNVMAITIKSPYIPTWEINEAKKIAEDLNLLHVIHEVDILDDILDNPKDRCYLCKKYIFNRIIEVAKENGYDFVIDGTNYDDSSDYRPGMKALKQLNILSPLFESELTKAEIRAISKELGLQTWDKPAYSCLLTRIPHGQRIKADILYKIERAEKYLFSLGFMNIRVRVHGDNLARIELGKGLREKMNVELMDKIDKRLKKIGFKFVCMDLEGYKMGKMN